MEPIRYKETDLDLVSIEPVRMKKYKIYKLATLLG